MKNHWKCWKCSSLAGLFLLMLFCLAMPLSAAAAPAATINGKEYASMQDAVANVQDGQTIVLQKNITESITAGRSVKFTINLNKKTWTGKGSYVALYAKSGTITIKNGKMAGNGGVIWVDGKKAKVTVSSGTYTSAKGSLLYNSQGTLLLKNGTFKAAQNVLVNYGTGKTTIYKGTYTSSSKGGNYSVIAVEDGTVSIKGGTINGNGGALGVTGKNASVTAEGGTFTSKGTLIYNSAGTVLIKDGTYKASENILMNCGTGKTTIYRGKFTGTSADYALTYNKDKAKLRIAGGSFSGKFKTVGKTKICLGIYREGGTVTIDGGKLNGKKIVVTKAPSR
ncbi:MAG: hypothetical protein SOZ59_11385 [Candidatus Limivivens sp.]|nr:hypothetical protein [Candidatus Limivivens sp.]